MRVPRRPSRVGLIAVLGVAAVVGAAGCSAARPSASSSGNVVPVAASINAWGSILSQLGGVHVSARSLITNPDTDPHDYEPSPADARIIAGSRLFLENGIGYDPWAAKALAASPDPGRRVIDVGQLVHVPADGNPHRWYDPANVETVAATITSTLKQIDPADSGYFDGRLSSFETALAPYRQLIDAIKAKYAGTPIGASESIVAPLADALGLTMRTPATFLKAISQGTDPSAADKSTIDKQIATKAIKVYVYNKQNSTPDVAAQVAACRKQGIAVVAVTETLAPANATFQQWQVTQLQALESALHTATGR